MNVCRHVGANLCAYTESTSCGITARKGATAEGDSLCEIAQSLLFTEPPWWVWASESDCQTSYMLHYRTAVRTAELANCGGEWMQDHLRSLAEESKNAPPLPVLDM